MKAVLSILDCNIVVFVAIGTISMLCLWGLLSRHSNNPFVALLVMMVFRVTDLPLNAMRFGIAMMLAVRGIGFLLDKKPIKFVVAVVVGSLFHKSMLAALLLWPFSAMKLYSKKNSQLFLIMSVASVFFVSMRLALSSFFFSGMYDIYEGGELGIKLKALTFALLIVSFVFVLMLRSLDGTENYERNVLFSGSVLSVLIGVVMIFNGMVDRLAVFFSVCTAMLIAELLFQKGVVMARKKYAGLFVAGCLSIYIMGGPAPGVVPYSFFWSPRINSSHKTDGATFYYQNDEELPVMI